MDAEKIRNMTDAELQHQQGELNDQLFRLKFQLKMGQTESLKKIRGLRKDVARIQTIMREKELGLGSNGKSAGAEAETPTATPATRKPAARKKKSSAARKNTKPSVARRKTAAGRTKKKSASGQKTRKK